MIILFLSFDSPTVGRDVHHWTPTSRYPNEFFLFDPLWFFNFTACVADLFCHFFICFFKKSWWQRLFAHIRHRSQKLCCGVFFQRSQSFTDLGKHVRRAARPCENEMLDPRPTPARLVEKNMKSENLEEIKWGHWLNFECNWIITISSRWTLSLKPITFGREVSVSPGVKFTKRGKTWYRLPWVEKLFRKLRFLWYRKLRFTEKINLGQKLLFTRIAPSAHPDLARRGGQAS